MAATDILTGDLSEAEHRTQLREAVIADRASKSLSDTLVVCQRFHFFC